MVRSKLNLARTQLEKITNGDVDAIRKFERVLETCDLLEAPQYVDIDFPIIISTTGPGIPSLVALNGNITLPQWQVNDSKVVEAQEIVHAYKIGSPAQWHIHLTTNGIDGTNRYVRFTIEYGYVAINNAWQFPALYTSPDLLIPANTPNKTMLVFNLASFTPPDGIGDHAVARLVRIASVGAAPTSNPWVSMLQLHIQVDTLGSRTVSAK